MGERQGGLTEEQQKEAIMYGLLKARAMVNSPLERTAAMLAVLDSRFRSGRLHPDDYQKEKELVLDRLASDHPRLARGFRTLDTSSPAMLPMIANGDVSRQPETHHLWQAFYGEVELPFVKQ